MFLAGVKGFGCVLRYFFSILSVPTFLFLGNSAVAETDKRPVVAITQVVEHAALDRTREGILDALEKSGLHMEILYENAQGNLPTAIQIAKKFASIEPAVIIAISTPSAQTALRATASVSIVFSAVSDPDSAGLITGDLRERVTGTVDLPPVSSQLDFFQALLPKMRRIGVLYNAGESNAVSFVGELKKEASLRNITIIEASVMRTSDVSAAVQKLAASSVDAIVLPQDNTVASALDVVVQHAHGARIPLLASDTDLIGRGVLAAIGFSRFEAGLETGRLAIEILKGVRPADLPIRPAGKEERVINGQILRNWGYTLPSALKAKVRVMD